jgi:hypothetical protein
MPLPEVVTNSSARLQLTQPVEIVDERALERLGSHLKHVRLRCGTRSRRAGG